MEKESKMDVEYVQIAIPGVDYERKLYLLVVALLNILEKDGSQDKDTKITEVTQ